MIQAVIYARYSSDQQRDASIEDQVRICRERAEREGWAVASVYSDHGLSGASLLRPGIQQLMQDATRGKFTIVIAESLDRLSRDQEDIAGFYKRMRFAGVSILTLSEGEVGDLHIGLKGTMNAIFLKDLADKTRRGIRGRVEAGKSGGGNSYGYDVVRKFESDGSPVRGDRTINEAQAAIVRRIFSEYATGKSPRLIAKELNAQAVPGPSGHGWGPSTIHGNRQRGTGILNNELYVGKLVWNRLRYIKDPETGKRVSRPNPESAWIVQDVPELRIVDDELWQAAKARQEENAADWDTSGLNFWDRKRPRYLFSGLVSCGVCGGGVVNINAIRVGCANARNKGTCDNRQTMQREKLEAIVLDGLREHLMEPELFALFCEEYTRHMNALRIEATSALAGYRAQLAKVTRDIDRLITAILDGVGGAQVKDRITSLEARKEELELLLDAQDEPVALLHPNMALHYRREVARLHAALADEEHRLEAVEIIRSLVDRIVLTPASEGKRKSVAVDLQGHLAGILVSAVSIPPSSP
ncbi:recombinase family protein [Salinarimonas rosea]|uniref:recombinase family protein n=1 Tax=Salinarimonas rosea TaxID=552063 RepID=UPI001FD8E189|nr:recombinase family protein [Salinarimonas rosea]